MAVFEASLADTPIGKIAVHTPIENKRKTSIFTLNSGRRHCLSQRESSGDDVVHTVALSEDGSVIMAGSTTGVLGESIVDPGDFAAAKLDADGNLVWTWQVKCRYSLLRFIAKVGTGRGVSFD